jgi:hypothetical protein
VKDVGLKSPMDSAHRTYKAYLLRLWREPVDQRWRVIIQEPHSDERRAFSTLRSFFNFLEDLTESEIQDD